MSNAHVFVANHGRKPEKQVTVTPDFTNGDIVVSPEAGSVITKVTIQKPTDLIPSNIVVGAEIAGIVGTATTSPTLHTPTITRSGVIISVSNPSTNGDFVTGYKLYNGETFLRELNETSFDISDFAVGSYSFNVKVEGNNFLDSASSNSVAAAVLAVKNVLDGLTTNNAATKIVDGQAYSATLTANANKLLPPSITVTFDGVATTNFTYDSSTGAISVPNVTGTLVITATADDMPVLTTPTVALASDGYTLNITQGSDAETVVIYVDDEEYLEVTV